MTHRIPLIIIISAEQPEMAWRGQTCLATSEELVQEGHGNDIKPCHHLPFHAQGTSVIWCSDLHKWLWATPPPVSTQRVFVRCLSTLSSGKGPQLNSTRWVYRHTQELRRQADLQWLHHFLHKACPFYMEGSQEFTVASAQLHLHLCLSVNLRLPEQLEFIWETNLPFSFNVMPHLLTFCFKKCIRQDAI